METESKKCYRCKNLDRYYTKEVKRFCKTKFGWCSEKQDTVQIQGCCDKFIFNPKSKKSNRMICHYLNDLLTEISEIRKVIEEENGETDESEEL